MPVHCPGGGHVGQSRTAEVREGSGLPWSVKSQLLEGEGEEAAPCQDRWSLAGFGEGERGQRKKLLLTLHFLGVSGLTALRGYEYTHFTDHHGGAKVTDLLKTSQLLSDSCDSSAGPCSRASLHPLLPWPHAASWRQQWAAWQAWRVGKGVWRGRWEPGWPGSEE